MSHVLPNQADRCFMKLINRSNKRGGPQLCNPRETFQDKWIVKLLVNEDDHPCQNNISCYHATSSSVLSFSALFSSTKVSLKYESSASELDGD